jgi:hypothetical protein
MRKEVALMDIVNGPVCAGGAVIVSVTLSDCIDWPGEVPCTVNVVVPVAAAPPTLTVIELDAVVASTCGGLNAAVTPVGNPVARSDTEPLKPPVLAMVMERLLLPLRAIDSDAPDADMTKPPLAGGGGDVVPPSSLPPPPQPVARISARLTVHRRLGLGNVGTFRLLETMRCSG